MYEKVKTNVRTQGGVTVNFLINDKFASRVSFEPLSFTLVLDILTKHIKYDRDRWFRHVQR